MSNNQQSGGRKSVPMKTTLHRHYEVNVKNAYYNQSDYNMLASGNAAQKENAANKEPLIATSRSANKFSKPQMNTALKQLEQISAINSIKMQPLKATSDLTPRSKAAIIPKLTKKLNFDIYRPVFKNLQTLNVNDSYLLPEKPASIQKKYKPQSTNKIISPELYDFLDPLPPLKHIVEVPDIILEFPEPEFDFLAAYKESVEY